MEQSSWLPWVDYDLDSVFTHLRSEEAFIRRLYSQCLCGVPLRGLEFFISVTRTQAVWLISLSLEHAHSAWVLNTCLNEPVWLPKSILRFSHGSVCYTEERMIYLVPWFSAQALEVN